VYKTAPEVSETILDVCDVPNAKDKWVYWDITNTVNSWYNGEENYGIKLSSSYLENNQSMFYSANSEDLANAPFLSVEYKTVSSEQIENRRSVDIVRAGKAKIDDFSGNLILSREDIGYNGKVMPVNISMVYSLNDSSNPTFGFGFKTNYTQTIKSVYVSGKFQYYEYVCGDGSKIYFYYNNIADKYIDMSGSGYTIKCKDKNETGYDNLVVIDSGGKEHHFEKYGRVVKIVDTSVTSKPAIELKYDDNLNNFYHIEYITDGAGRKYKFNYNGIKLTDTDIFYTHFVVSVNYSNQINEALFDGIVVYKSDYTYNDSTPSTELDDNESSSTNENFSSTVNSDNNVTETIKKDGMKTVNVFDKYGNNLRNETEVDGKSVLKINEYTEDGNYPRSSTDSLGFKTSYSYDSNTGYLNSITDAEGNSVNYSYNNIGKVQKVSHVNIPFFYLKNYPVLISQPVSAVISK